MHQDQLDTFLAAADDLRLKGLSGSTNPKMEDKTKEIKHENVLKESMLKQINWLFMKDLRTTVVNVNSIEMAK